MDNKNKERKPRGYWNYETCKEEALKYISRVDYHNKSRLSFNYASRNNFLDEICNHMEILGDKYKRLIYIYKFADNHVYIGLTCNSEKRKHQHKNDIKSPVYKYCQKSGLEPIYEILSGYLYVKDAQKLEKEFINKFKNDNYILLNSNSGGGLGATEIFWTYDRCKEEALKYKSRGEFKINSGGYNPTRVNGWLNELCSHMIDRKKPNGYWDNYDRCKEEALKYKSRSEFKKCCSSGYRNSFKNFWLDEICSHMISDRKYDGYWTYDRCKEEALKYNSRIDFKRRCGSGYQKSLLNKWLNDFFKKE